MTLANITRDAVIKAINEFDELGQETFLINNRFGDAIKFFLIYKGKKYPSKAIVGVAHKFIDPDGNPLLSRDFSGGKKTVVKLLENLGFIVEERNTPR